MGSGNSGSYFQNLVHKLDKEKEGTRLNFFFFLRENGKNCERLKNHNVNWQPQAQIKKQIKKENCINYFTMLKKSKL